MLDGLPRIVFVSPFDIECCDAFAEALADAFFWLIDVLAGRLVEGTRGCALFARALRLRRWRRRAFLARWLVRASPTRARIDDSISDKES